MADITWVDEVFMKYIRFETMGDFLQKIGIDRCDDIPFEPADKAGQTVDEVGAPFEEPICLVINGFYCTLPSMSKRQN